MKRLETFKKLIIFCVNIIWCMLLDNAKAASNPDKCIGKHQIPLNRKLIKTEYRSFEPIVFNHFDVIPDNTTWENNANTVIVNMQFTKDLPNISGGPMEIFGPFRLYSIYFHWLENASPGYNYENITFPAELHMAFFDKKFSSFFQALASKYSIAVLAFGIKVATEGVTYFDAILNELTALRGEYTKELLPHDKQLSLYSFMPSDLEYYITYRGSMMYHSCTADVVWVDFQNPITVNPIFVKRFTQMLAYDRKPLMSKVFHAKRPVGEVREPEDINGTAIHMSENTVNGVSTVFDKVLMDVGILVLFCLIYLI